MEKTKKRLPGRKIVPVQRLIENQVFDTSYDNELADREATKRKIPGDSPEFIFCIEGGLPRKN